MGLGLISCLAKILPMSFGLCKALATGRHAGMVSSWFHSSDGTDGGCHWCGMDGSKAVSVLSLWISYLESHHWLCTQRDDRALQALASCASRIRGVPVGARRCKFHQFHKRRMIHATKGILFFGRVNMSQPPLDDQIQKFVRKLLMGPEWHKQQRAICGGHTTRPICHM